jgi:hypothetical protein
VDAAWPPSTHSHSRAATSGDIAAQLKAIIDAQYDDRDSLDLHNRCAFCSAQRQEERIAVEIFRVLLTRHERDGDGR